ncbi:hypothetical protein GOP47_0026911 [Adiantum capillus-veneris]|nr:hypothetical protein GOP47_0026911 [Adiantum capillus-veneris]
MAHINADKTAPGLDTRSVEREMHSSPSSSSFPTIGFRASTQPPPSSTQALAMASSTLQLILQSLTVRSAWFWRHGRIELVSSYVGRVQKAQRGF